MGFLSILVAWALMRWHGPIEPLQRDRWLARWSQWISAQLSPLPPVARALVVCGLPCLLVAAIGWTLAPWLGGVVYFAFGLLVLLYSLGRGNMHAQLDAYLERWSRGDLEAAYRAAEATMHIDARARVDDVVSLHARVRKAVLYTALVRWFAVVFWFYLLGPAAGLFYRLVQLHVAKDAAPLQKVLFWLEWLPVRLLGLAFAITGHFAAMMRIWREHWADNEGSAELLSVYAMQALDGVVADAGSTQFVQRAGNELHELGALLRRSVVCWLVLFALLQMVR